jgi:hypothetical protein
VAVAVTEVLLDCDHEFVIEADDELSEVSTGEIS